MDKETLVNLVNQGIEHEKSKYPNWDDKKDMIKVEIKFEGQSLKLFFSKKDKQGGK
jgi:hypothetical protein